MSSQIKCGITQRREPTTITQYSWKKLQVIHFFYTVWLAVWVLCRLDIRTSTLLCLCVFLHPAQSVRWQHLPASCTGATPSARSVGKGQSGAESCPRPYSFSQPPQPQKTPAVQAANQRRAITLSESWSVPSSITLTLSYSMSGGHNFFTSECTELSVSHSDRKHV